MKKEIKDIYYILMSQSLKLKTFKLPDYVDDKPLILSRKDKDNKVINIVSIFKFCKNNGIIING